MSKCSSHVTLSDVRDFVIDFGDSKSLIHVVDYERLYCS